MPHTLCGCCHRLSGTNSRSDSSVGDRDMRRHTNVRKHSGEIIADSEVDSLDLSSKGALTCALSR